MLDRIIQYSISHKLIILLFSAVVASFGLYSLFQISIGAVPDVTNNQVQIITTSRNLATEDVEKFLTYPVELEMSNLPDLKEIRSISKFGLSVVTVVFNDEIGTYLPRQLIAEKIKAAQNQIPDGFGTPFMGPITTGLGEIYQYVLEVDSAYKHQYDLAELRSIQDWIVKRQLAGIPGVVEINTWGGFLKQYEVAIDPSKLRQLNISLSQVYSAIESNNSVAGGGYIEKTHQTFFVRGEGLVKNLDDIKMIVIENRDGTPILVKDIANVRFGHATRFGAITGNGEGEKVLGQVMMLKGANSNAVIDAVKQRVSEISKTLPPGVHINAFLERSELIGKTTLTIAENLILGFLIVIFVVVLLLGNLRSGLVVASVIPLSLLFTLSLMNLFDVDANLMSLGAIDFGIIIDGAVIIVEFIAFKITSAGSTLLSLDKDKRKKHINQITFSGASKMMHSAIFGQLIIIIVFIPILSLVGVEGKMFRPMALVFVFALLGAMILCFTYVPVMASLLIKPVENKQTGISFKLIQFLENLYQPTLKWVLRRKAFVITSAFTLLIIVSFIFSRMGGEFVPTLDEGDFVIQPVLKTGTSLSNTIKITTQIEKLLLEFPEVDQVVTRIGAAEVPTDPMSMEETDVIIKLKPKHEWITANSKDELANKFKDRLSVLAGIDVEFTQPIEMRFNELITGVRADLAIKIFGEDLDVLYKKAVEIEDNISGIEGAADISVEKIVGLPQMSVKYDRNKLAKYGLNVNELNHIIRSGFAGLEVGTVYEGEKQFDLVIRFDKDKLKDISALENTTIQLPNGNHLPFRTFASINYEKGPAKISRDDTKRRIVVGVNVRNRDLQSVVNDVEKTINDNIKLPPGYSIEYGGQFENLQTARKRLLIAVPISLVLIFILLYFAFDSVKEALLIYSAIPLAAVGGVILLYVRNMPFSISAGVGFIALFGIAVLNGIVLIEEFKELKTKGIRNIHRRILIGTRNRLRPVLLTASAAALGFLPMAISTSAGAEVQRPLATVVIGGLISATILTLVVLPVLYSIFDSFSLTKRRASTAALLLILLFPALSSAQTIPVSLEKAIELSIANNADLKSSELRIKQQHELLGTAYDFEKTEIYYHYDENNLAINNRPISVFGVNQSFKFPTIYGTQKKLLNQYVHLSKSDYEIKKRKLILEVSKAYHKLVYLNELKSTILYLDSLYSNFELVAKRRFELGETNYLETLTARSKRRQINLNKVGISEQLNEAKIQFNYLIQADNEYTCTSEPLQRLFVQPADTIHNPILVHLNNAIKTSKTKLEVEKHLLLPDINTSFFGGTNNGLSNQYLYGFQVGVAIPLWFGNQQAKIKAAKINSSIVQVELHQMEKLLSSKYEALKSEINSLNLALNEYEEFGRELSKETIVHADISFNNGEINFLQYIQLLENAKELESEYLRNLFNYNNTVIEMNYLLND